MMLRFLNLQGMIGIAVSVVLLGLFLVKANEARRWHKQADRFERSYLAEQSARAGTIANYRAAAETARRQDLANAGRVAAEQRIISERTTHDLQARLADARARALRLQLGTRTAATAQRGGGATAVPAAGATPGLADRAAEEDGLPLAAQDFSLEDRLIATEQAIQLDELIKWVIAQAAVDTQEFEK
ncbi:MAG TPA: hypothetical protein VMN38_08900 [Sphingomicrobium sp.]|nr:hypothetical protein [Sphingomicrobium sp.]